jgi:hypothetical protein
MGPTSRNPDIGTDVDGRLEVPAADADNRLIDETNDDVPGSGWLLWTQMLPIHFRPCWVQWGTARNRVVVPSGRWARGDNTMSNGQMSLAAA